MESVAPPVPREQHYRFVTEATHRGEAFIFSVPRIKTLVELADLNTSMDNLLSSKDTGRTTKVLFTTRNDFGGNQWAVSYEKDAKGVGRLGLEVTRPIEHLNFAGGNTPPVFGPEVHWMKNGTYQPFEDFEVKLIKLQPGDSKRWNIGTVPDVFASCSKGDLWVKVQVVYYYQCHMKRCVPAVGPPVSETKMKTQVASDLGQLLNDGDSEFSDFHVKVDGTKSFHLHKAILAARSPTIQDLFKEGVSDLEVANRITESISARVMEILVHYIYNGKLLSMTENDDIETVEQLLVTAEKWDIPMMKPLLNEKVVDCLTLENAEYLLELSVLHELHTAETKVSHFITKNIRRIMALKKGN